MSRYVRSLIERARGEGAMLQPRPRSRFEPAEPDGVAPVSDRPPVSPSSTSDTTNITNIANSNTEITNASVLIQREHESRPEAGATRFFTERANTVVRAETLHSTERTDRTERVERDRTHHEFHDAITREREQLTHRDQRTIEKREQRHERSERTRHTTQRDRIIDREDARPIQITIGRVDVRAVAPQTQTPQRPQQKPKPAPLTLDDYLRGKR